MNDEHWRDNLIGCTFSKRLEEAALRRHGIESALTRMDVQKQHLLKLLTGRKAELLPNMHESVMCAVLEPKNRKIIDVGFNDPKDLILDNFGKWLAAFVRSPIAGSGKTVVLPDSSNTNRTLYIYDMDATTTHGFQYGAAGGSPTGTQVQVGSGSSDPARSDYAIQTAFGAAPENAAFDTGSGSYSSGYVSFSGAITAGGSGTINETGFFGKWYLYNASYLFMLFHDKLTSGVAFTAGQTLNVSYSIEL